MLESLEPRPGDILVKILASEPQMSAGALHERVCTEHREVTLQAIYYELRKLERQGVVVKSREAYRLDLTWVFRLLSLADQVYDHQVVNASENAVLPKANSSQSWKFRSLVRLDDFWVHIMLLVFQATRKRCMFSWSPHPYFYFLKAQKLQLFYDFLLSEKKKICIIIGGDTYLDHLFTELMSDELYECSVAPEEVAFNEKRYFTSIGDYIIQVKLNSSVLKNIDSLFRSISSQKDIDPQRINLVLMAKGNFTLTVEHNPRKARGILRKYVRHFGLRADEL